MEEKENQLSQLAQDFIEAAAKGFNKKAEGIFKKLFEATDFDHTADPVNAFETAIYCIQHPVMPEDVNDIMDAETRDMTDNEIVIIETMRRKLNIPELKAA